jgi:recombinational DNA repair ATPase RecF
VDDELLSLVSRRLDRAELEDEAALLVLAACEGDDTLLQAVAGNRPALREPQAIDETSAEPSGAYLLSITAEGFRGVGERRSLDLRPGPGLTLVVGRNGSGKSSFVEGLEVLLTGDSRRWSSRREQAWREGWRNLHHPNPSSVGATLAVDGTRGPTALERCWAERVALEDSEATAQPHGSSKQPLASLGWADALVAYRPILSYNELGSILDEGPSHLYDELANLLGLDDLAVALERLRSIRLALTKAIDEAKKRAKPLVRELEDLDDERAVACALALAGATWNLDAVAAVVTGTSTGAGPTTELEQLRSLAQIAAPDAELVAAAIGRAREAADEQDAVAGTDAEAADRTATLLRAAVDHHNHAGDEPCPVCGVGRLDADWVSATQRELEQLDRIARTARHAETSVREARRRLVSLQTVPPAPLPEAARLGLSPEATQASWAQWLEIDTTALRAAADAFEALAPELHDAVANLRVGAQTAYTAREDRWQPVAERLATWLDQARQAESANTSRPHVSTAEDWLRTTIDELRNERLTPIAAQADTIWRELSQQSNVELGPITLTGSGNRRRVNLDVTVDGKESVALSVMSQGELHALALAIFLPRATQAQSPFRFLVVDDPVQAMDPAKVDGLARVLEHTAKTRQVIVFTHDDRLPQAIRRLEVDADVYQVTRRDGSVVDIRRVQDPATVYLDDAIAVALTDDLPTDARRRVVPGYCRHALEATFNDVVRRKQIGDGVAHAEVEDRLAAVTTLNTRAALAFFGDAQRGGEVLSRLGAFGRWAQDAYQACNRGSHDVYAADLPTLVRDTRQLVEKLRTIP